MSMTMIPPGTEHVRVAQSSNAVPGPSRTTGRGPRRWGEAPAAVVLAIVLLGSLVPRGWLPQGSDGADGLPFDAPSATHLLGTDITGRDVLAQTVTGGGLVVLVAAAVSGAVVGLCAVLAAAATLSARVRSVVRFGVETMLLVPSLLLLVTVMVSLSSWGVGAVLLACILAGVPYCAQVLLAAAVPLSRAGFVQVALASGDTRWQVAVREVIPALGSELAAQLRLRFLEAVLVLSTAVFLGVSTPLAADSWAAMIRQNAPGLALNPWAVLAPALCLAAVGAAIAATVGRRTAGGDAPDAEASDPVHRSCAPWAFPEPAPGRVLILRGPSGSGKTTALHALAGEDPVGGSSICATWSCWVSSPRGSPRPRCTVGGAGPSPTWRRMPPPVSTQGSPPRRSSRRPALPHRMDPAGRPRAPPASCWRHWAWQNWRQHVPGRCPAVRRDGWVSPPRWPVNDRCCCSMSRCPVSTGSTVGGSRSSSPSRPAPAPRSS